MESLFRSHILSTGHSLETAKTYQANVAIFERWAHSKNVIPDQATRADVETYLAEEFSRLARNSVAGRLAALRAYFEFLGRPEATAGLKIRREQLAPQRPYHQEDLDALMEAATTDRDRALMALALETGTRISELVGIRRDDIDLRDRRLLVRGKGGKERELFLTPRAVLVITPYARAGLGPIWRTQDGRPLTVGHAKTTLTRIGARAGVQAHWHKFRTTFANRFLARSNGNIDALRVIMGHRDTTTTQRYAEAEATDRALLAWRKISE